MFHVSIRAFFFSLFTVLIARWLASVSVSSEIETSFTTLKSPPREPRLQAAPLFLYGFGGVSLLSSSPWHVGSSFLDGVLSFYVLS